MKKFLTITLLALLTVGLFVSCDADLEEPSGLCFVAKEKGSKVSLGKKGTPIDATFQYSKDGVSWQDYSLDKEITLKNIGDKVYFRAKARVSGENAYGNYYHFTGNGKVSVKGNIMYLLDPSGETTTMPNRAFNNLFNGNTALVSAKGLLLPASTLMLGCYSYMFQDCINLTECPELKATVLAASCYHGMFLGCSKLTKAPELPAKNLARSCYESMFWKCALLTTAPVLPAETLVTNCYAHMFDACSKLDSVTMLAKDISATDCLLGWLKDVAASGTLVKAKSMTTLPSGESGIPSNWTTSDYT